MRVFVLAAAALAAALAGCRSTPEEQSPAAVEERQPAAVAAPTPAPAAKPQPVKPGEIARVDLTAGKPAAAPSPLKDPANILSRRSIYFDYDRYEVKEEYRPIVEAHAKYLRENPEAKVLIQGNADERGSREYNIGLGQRRSDAVKRMLILLGARESQIEAVSLGEEKPVCTESNEACWAKNRRGDILYQGEY
ncbi:MAG: peptidoglycan-associated lipoprotein Pal [Burkholderiales bacterium]|nr:peptidoglycan-associated lipoprotein Pal [Burkholderiales bacterium]